MSFARLQRLEQWLSEVLKVPTENFTVSLEQGSAEGFFNDVELLRLTGEPVIDADNSSIDVPMEPAGVQMDFGMRDSYMLVVVLRNYGEDPTRIKAGLLRWLHNEGQGGGKPVITWDSEKNNQSTYDWFFDLKIEEKTHNVGAELRTC